VALRDFDADEDAIATRSQGVERGDLAASQRVIRGDPQR
jgi:hypothetical protein